MHPFQPAFAAAQALVQELAPYCAQIEIAGSLRRRAPVVKDLEVVALGHVSKEPVPGDLFGEQRPFDHLEHFLDPICGGRERHLRRGRPTTDGGRVRKAPWGPRYKRLELWHARVWYAVDLFQPTAETWGPVLVIRTGPADFSRLLVTPREHGGAMPRGLKQHNGRLWRFSGNAPGEPIETPDEASYFAALGVPLWAPPERTEARLVAWLREHGITPPARTRAGEKSSYSPYSQEQRHGPRTES